MKLAGDGVLDDQRIILKPTQKQTYDLVLVITGNLDNPVVNRFPDANVGQRTHQNREKKIKKIGDLVQAATFPTCRIFRPARQERNRPRSLRQLSSSVLLAGRLRRFQ